MRQLTALQIKQAALGHEHFHVALIQWDLGMYKLHARKYSESHYLLDNALQVLSTYYPSRDHPVLQRMHRLMEEVRRATPRAPSTPNSALFNALKDKFEQSGSSPAHDLEHALFDRQQGDAVQQLFNKYLGDKSK